MTRRRMIFDPSEALSLCKRFNGYDGATKYLEEQGLKNPETGKPFSKHYVRYAASKAAGFDAWRAKREGERDETAKEFRRIAHKRIKNRKGA